jgi:hypothetical protein
VESPQSPNVMKLWPQLTTPIMFGIRIWTPHKIPSLKVQSQYVETKCTFRLSSRVVFLMCSEFIDVPITLNQVCFSIAVSTILAKTKLANLFVSSLLQLPASHTSVIIKSTQMAHIANFSSGGSQWLWR